MENIKEITRFLFNTFFVILVPIVLVIIIFTSHSIAEIITWIILVYTLIFYYAYPIQVFLLKIPVIPGVFKFIADLVGRFHDILIALIPEFKGISLFGKHFFQITVNPNYPITRWPIYILFAGVIIRIVLARYVKHEKLKRVGQGYWLFITTYLVTTLVVSYVVNWNYLKILVISLILAFLIAAGVLRVSADLLYGIGVILSDISIVIRIIFKYIAFLAARTTRILRNIVKFIRKLYQKYIIRPFQWIHSYIEKFLDAANRKADNLLRNERLDDDDD